jgi:hypothetical protein
MGDTRKSPFAKTDLSRKFMMLDLQNMWAPNKFMSIPSQYIRFIPSRDPKGIDPITFHQGFDWLMIRAGRNSSIWVGYDGDIRVQGQRRHFEADEVVLFVTVCAPQFAPVPWWQQVWIVHVWLISDQNTS